MTLTIDVDNGVDGKSTGGCVAAVLLMSSTLTIYVDNGKAACFLTSTINVDDGVNGKSAGGCVAAVSLMSSTSTIYVDDGVNNKSGGGHDAALLLILLMWCNHDCEIVDLGCI